MPKHRHNIIADRLDRIANELTDLGEELESIRPTHSSLVQHLESAREGEFEYRSEAAKEGTWLPFCEIGLLTQVDLPDSVDLIRGLASSVRKAYA